MGRSTTSWSLAQFPAHAGDVRCLALGHNSGRVMVTGGGDSKANLFVVGKEQYELSLDCQSPVDVVQFDHAEDTVVAGLQGGDLKIFDLEQARMKRKLAGHKVDVTSLCFHPCGEFMASGYKDTHIKLWDVKSKGCLFTYKGHSSSVNSLRFSPDGRWIASAGEDGSVKIWDLAAGKILHDLTHSSPVRAIEFHPSELLLASCSSTLKYLELDKFQEVCATDVNAGEILGLSFHPKNNNLLYGASHNTLNVYDGAQAECYDSHHVGWGYVADMAISQEQLIGATFSQTNVTQFVVQLQMLWPSKDNRPHAAPRSPPSVSTRSHHSSGEIPHTQSSKPTATRSNSQCKKSSTSNFSSSYTRSSLRSSTSSSTRPSVASVSVSRASSKSSRNSVESSSRNSVASSSTSSNLRSASLRSTSRSSVNIAAKSSRNSVASSSTSSTSSNLRSTSLRSTSRSSGNIAAKSSRNSVASSSTSSTSSNLRSTTLRSTSRSSVNIATPSSNCSTASSKYQQQNPSRKLPQEHKEDRGAVAAVDEKEDQYIDIINDPNNMDEVFKTRTHLANSPKRSIEEFISPPSGNTPASPTLTDSASTPSEQSLPIKKQDSLPTNKHNELKQEPDNIVQPEDFLPKAAPGLIQHGACSDAPTMSDIERETLSYIKNGHASMIQVQESRLRNPHNLFAQWSGANKSEIEAIKKQDSLPTNKHDQIKQEQEYIVQPEDFLLKAAPGLIQNGACRNAPTLSEIERETLSSIKNGHASRIQVMETRSNNLRTVLGLGSGGKVKAAIDAAIGLSDNAIIVDLLNVMIAMPKHWNLGVCASMMPQISALLSSKYETYVTTAMKALRLVLKNFGSVIIFNLKAQPSVGVDIARDERYSKCLVCYKCLMDIRELMNNMRFSEEQASIAHEIQLLMGQLE